MSEELSEDLSVSAEPMRRLLVANRGEIAVRVFDTARDMGMVCIGVYSDADRDAEHVRAADLAVHLPGTASADTYLNSDAIIEAARRTGAEAIHPGYGFLAENPDFARAVQQAGLVWVGPDPQSIAQMALKVEAKRIAAAAGVPLVPGAEIDEAADEAALAALAEPVGYPLLVKASAGGGGKGMRIVEDPADLATAIAGARREAASAFGDATVFLERYLPRARHVEVQVFGDGQGQYLHLYDRECSIQRRHQKVIEEAPSPGATAATRERMYAAALALAERISYTGAGTVEFMVSGDGDAQDFYFLEMNTRLQVEHRVTELITGTDLVQWQLLVAQGVPLTVAQEDIEIDGHAIQARLYAEDPAHDFLPGAGRLDVLDIPDITGCLVDTGYRSGDSIPSSYDPLIAKVVVHADERADAAEALAGILEAAAIEGVVTNRNLLVAVLRSFAFSVGDTTTSFLTEHPELLTQLPSADHDTDELLLVAAAVRQLCDAADAGPWPAAPPGALAADPVPPRYRNVPGSPACIGFTRDQDTEPVWVLLERVGGDEWSVAVSTADEPYADSAGAAPVRITQPATEAVAGFLLPGDDLLLERAGLTTRLTTTVTQDDRIVVSSADQRAVLRRWDPQAAAAHEALAAGPVAPVPGTVAHIGVRPGQQVRAGDTLVVLEAMKMEHTITADSDGVVTEVLVAAGQPVDAHQPLVTIGDGASEEKATEEKASEEKEAGDDRDNS